MNRKPFKSPISAIVVAKTNNEDSEEEDDIKDTKH
jgi:hypothetical protein